ncbi:hypothetical protein [Brevibacillus daliensis]|uniref:hypothetical protein n=1 Tax=Brevibacillus daliensis TaxID=2892995 RepID=UPI001E5C4B37|nr:hypothetical protein [Brevibacillus daliensis]
MNKPTRMFHINKSYKYVVLSLVASLVITACGGDGVGAQLEQENQQKPAGQVTTTKNKTPITNPKTEKRPEKTRIVSPTKMITFIIDGKEVSQEAKLFESDLGYYLYVIPGYVATGEEPGKDMIFSEKNDLYSVRIERLPKETEVATLRKNAEIELTDLGSVKDLTKEKDFPFVNKAAFRLGVDTDKEHKEIVAVKIDGEWFKFTLFTLKDKDAPVIIPKLWAMLDTIQVKK